MFRRVQYPFLSQDLLFTLSGFSRVSIKNSDLIKKDLPIIRICFIRSRYFTRCLSRSECQKTESVTVRDQVAQK